MINSLSVTLFFLISSLSGERRLPGNTGTEFFYTCPTFARLRLFCSGSGNITHKTLRLFLADLEAVLVRLDLALGFLPLFLSRPGRVSVESLRTGLSSVRSPGFYSESMPQARGAPLDLSPLVASTPPPA